MKTIGINFRDDEYALLEPDKKIEELLKKLGVDYEMFQLGG